MENLKDKLNQEHSKLITHPTYKAVRDIESLQIFMQYHVFAVWDFMSLLKSLQRKITCVSVPWVPSPFPKDVVRMINEIVLGEESDINHQGEACDHFTLYLDAMKEIGASTKEIECFLQDFDLKNLSTPISNFVSFNLNLALSDEPHRVAAAFFYGREKLIPDMFESILADIKDKKLDCPALIYYLERHIELDGDEHADLALKCLSSLCGDDKVLWEQSYQTGLESLKYRRSLWDGALAQIKTVQ